MTLVPVEKLPKKNTRANNVWCEYKSVCAYIQEFMRMGTKYVLVDITRGDYATIWSAYQTFRRCVKSSGAPVSVVVRDYKLYLIRRDLEDPNERL